MRWQGGRRGGNVEDRRGLGPVGLGGLGVGGVVLALVGYFVFGVDPSQTLGLLQGAQDQPTVAAGSPADEGGAFVDVIEASTTDVWSAKLPGYQPPAAIVLYDQATGTGCGMGQGAMGPFYCPQDRKVYLDLSFWRELEGRFGAGGDFARAYVIAHEVGHHVQNLTGQMERARRLGAQGAESGSVRLELQADCYAGVWAAHATQVSNIKFTAQDVQDALTAASAVGDDNIQKSTSGQVVPDSFTHGSSAQRVRWFRKGYEAGDPDACDTFGAAAL